MKPLHNPYHFLFVQWKNKFFIMFEQIKCISISNGVLQNFKHIKNIIILFPLVYHMRKVYFPLILLCYVIAIPLLLFVRLIRPIIHIRFGRLLASGFGQCIMVAEVYLSRKNLEYDEKNIEIK